MEKTSPKDIPSVNRVIMEIKKDSKIHESYLKKIIQDEIEVYRKKIKNGELNKSSLIILNEIKYKILSRSSHNLVNVINGTGIVLHTGFGRAPFNVKNLKKIAKKMEGYVNLEFDLNNGKRGDRQEHVRHTLSSICESESSLVVNNNAAAVMLAINGIAKGGEVIVSRGELVEIGGSFRIPNIIHASGAILKEVGTTNRTHIKDYKDAINKNTKLILNVHTSNYIVKGFTKSVRLAELVSLRDKYSIPVMVDWGSGSLLKNISKNVSLDIPINQLMKDKPDIVTFSGDKLIGGPQSGIIVGGGNIIKDLQKNTLYRTFRPDKLTIGLLEETLRGYRSTSFSKDNLSLHMLKTPRKILRKHGEKVISLIKKSIIKDLDIALVSSMVEAGSGSLPEKNIKSMALIFNPKIMKCSVLAKKLRLGKIPVVGFIKEDRFYIDLKAVLPSQLIKLSQAINSI
tara:strand:- start:1893 stop:3260 length:1368 start_codon:yes stop_codon:yes gene_type:complete